MASLSAELNKKHVNTSLTDDYDKLVNEVGDMDVMAYKAYLLDKAGKIQQDIDRADLSPAAKQILSLEKELDTLEQLTQAPGMLTQAYLEKNHLDREKGRAYFQQMAQSIPEDYIPADIQKSLNVPQALLVEPYRHGIMVSAYNKDKYAQAWGTDEGVFFDVARAVLLYQNIKDFTPLTDKQQKELDTLPAAYKEMLQQANVELLERLEANKKKSGFTINEAGEVSDEDLFASIISPFRGKVLLVDIWATWCGPCRMANKAMIPMKEELKDKDIVYIYITGETSPLKTWENMIPDIHGEHYRVTNAQWEYLSKSFKVEGVPTYLIIDREGNIKSKQTGSPE